MGNLLGLLSKVVDLVKQIQAWFASGPPWRKREQAAEPEPPSPTIPGPDGRYEFTRATTVDTEELNAMGEAIGRRCKLQPAADLGELMVGDLLTFRVELLGGREPQTSWGWGRAICPRRTGSILTKVFRVISFDHVEGLQQGKVIEVPREALTHVFRVTATGVP
jgi:hypothetical protein